MPKYSEYVPGELLTENARRAKRNVMFFSLVQMALASGLLYSSEGGRLVVPAVGLQTSIDVLIWSLAALIVYNLASLWLHGPTKSRDSKDLGIRLMDPASSPSYQNRESLLEAHLLRVVGPRAISKKTPTWRSKRWDEVGRIWFEGSEMDPGVESGLTTEEHHLRWQMLPWVFKLLLRLHAAKHYRDMRLEILEVYWDFWLPIAVGVCGLAATGAAIWRLPCP